jgi:hypothetical protein
MLQQRTLKMAVYGLIASHFDTFRPNLQPNPKTALEQGVAEGLDAESYKQKLLSSLPQMMRFYEKNVKGWKPSKEQMLAAVETGYMVMKHTGDVKQAGKAVMDELNTLHRMSQGQGVAEGFSTRELRNQPPYDDEDTPKKSSGIEVGDKITWWYNKFHPNYEGIVRRVAGMYIDVYAPGSGQMYRLTKDDIRSHEKQGVAEAGEVSQLHKALDRALSKEKKASPAQVQRNKERWAQRQAEKNKEVDEGYDKWGWHTSVTNGEFMPTKYGNKAYVYLHDMDNQSANGNPQLVTFNKPVHAKKAAAQFGGKVVKTDLNTYRVVKPELTGVAEEKTRLDPKCWDGYKKAGTKMKGGVRVNNCVKEELEETYDGDEFFEAYGELWYNEDEQLDEAEYHGRSVPLGKPMQGDVKKFKVYVKDPSTGNVKKVNFGDPDMKIRKSNPAARRSFRARHNCDNPGPRTKARYWSCRKW